MRELWDPTVVTKSMSPFNNVLQGASDENERKDRRRKKYEEMPDAELEKKIKGYQQAKENVKNSELPSWSSKHNSVLDDELDDARAEQGARRFKKDVRSFVNKLRGVKSSDD